MPVKISCGVDPQCVHFRNCDCAYSRGPFLRFGLAKGRFSEFFLAFIFFVVIVHVLLSRLLVGVAELRVELFDEVGGGFRYVGAWAKHGLGARRIKRFVI